MHLRDFYSCLRKVGLYLLVIVLIMVVIICLVILDFQTVINPERVTASSTLMLTIVTFLLVCLSYFNLQQMQKDRKIQHIAQKLENMYYPILDSIDSHWDFQNKVIKLYYLRYLADNDLREKLTDYRNNLNAPNLEERRSEIKKIVKDKVPKIEEEYNRLIGG